MNTTHTREPIEQKEKQKANRLLDELDLRDYFAAKAMQAIVLDHVEQRYWGTEYGINEMLTFTAERAYQQADAMLKAREAS
jgi:hypothetical protein